MKTLVEWNIEYQYDGLLFFAQRIVEMLDYTTVDIFRAPLMNTSRLINEYLTVSHGSAKKYHLEEIFNEFIDSLNNDIVINHCWGEDCVNQIVKKLNKEQANRETIMEYLSHVVGSQYLMWAKKYLLYIIPQNREKKKIERGIRCFIPELLNCGYSRDEIYRAAKYMLTNDIDASKALENFFNRFDRRKREYTVYTAISNKLLIFQNTLETRLKISFMDDGNFDKVDTWDKYSKIKINHIKSLDPSSAADIAYKEIELFTSFYQFFGDYSGRLIQNRVFVISDDGEEQRITVDINKYKAVEETNTPRIGYIAELCITNLICGARCALPQLQKIVKLHNRAIANNGMENGFLNLWSILEVICVTDSNASKIEQIVNSDLAENIKRVLEPTQYSMLLSDISTGTSECEKIASFLFLPEYTEKLDTFIDNLCMYPLLRTRMLNLHDNCSCRRDLYCITERYAQRVSWHLYRIYRARNSITHSGKKPVDLKDLGEHLHTYVDSVAREVIVKLCTGTLCHISNVLVDSELLNEKWNMYFSASEPINADTIKFICSSQMKSEN